MSSPFDKSDPNVEALVNQSKVECQKYKTSFIINNPPIVGVNSIEASALIIPHVDPVVCPNCGTGYIPLIGGYTLNYVWTEAAPKETKGKLITIPSRAITV